MKIFRLEHESDGVGPFHYKGKSGREILFYLETSHSFMPELDDIPEVRRIIKENPECVFGWNCKKLYDKMIVDADAVHNLGFRLKIYDRPALYTSKCGQVLFLKQ